VAEALEATINQIPKLMKRLNLDFASISPPARLE
jgi:hypothetical protein